MLTTRINFSLGSGALSRRKKFTQLIQNLEIWDRSEWPKETCPRFGDNKIRELAEEFKVCFRN
jgi:hypothetical protein